MIRLKDWHGFRLVVVVSLSVIVLAGCTTDDDETDPTLPTSAPTTAALVTPPPGATVPPADLSDANGQVVSDGLCQMLIPDGWVDDGTGRGTTSSGARYTLFGGRLRSDADWERAGDVVATPGAGRTIVSLDRSKDRVVATFGEDRGFEARLRFDDRYCDVTVSSAVRAIPAAERAYWDAIIESIARVE